VSAEGAFTAAENAAIQYNTLVGERIVSVAGMQTHLCNALTVAVRYGLVRRQGAHDEQIMDFQTHYAVLMPLLAGSYSLHFVRAAIYQRWLRVQAMAQHASTRTEFMRALPDMHALSASVKCHLGWWTADALELCRRSMGGHAYSAYAGIASVMNDYGVITTGGGDNVVLAQQHARFLLSALRHQAVPEAAPFVADVTANATVPTGAPLSAAQVVAVFRWLAAVLLGNAGAKLAAALGDGKRAEHAWNDNLLELVALSRVATHHYWLHAFLTGVEAVPDVSLRAALMPLVSLLSLHLLLRDSALLLEHRALQPEHLPLLREKRTSILQGLLLLSRFAFAKFVLHSYSLLCQWWK
jgi:acyl-CoA oxidase